MYSEDPKIRHYIHTRKGGRGVRGVLTGTKMHIEKNIEVAFGVVDVAHPPQ